MIGTRASLLRLLIAAERPPEEVVARLASFGWDSEDELVELTAVDAISVLRRFRHGSLDEQALREWADAIEGREDIEYQPAARAVLSDLVFELANPEITVPLTLDSAEAWEQRLSLVG